MGRLTSLTRAKNKIRQHPTLVTQQELFRHTLHPLNIQDELKHLEILVQHHHTTSERYLLGFGTRFLIKGHDESIFTPFVILNNSVILLHTY